MRISRLREYAVMCNEPECTSAAKYLVDSRPDPGGGDPGVLAAYCEEHAQRFLAAAGVEAEGVEAAPDSLQKRRAAAIRAAAAGGRKFA